MSLDLPDSASGAALPMSVNQTGMVQSRTVLLMTPEEMDAALKKKVHYRAPGA